MRHDFRTFETRPSKAKPTKTKAKQTKLPKCKTIISNHPKCSHEMLNQYPIFISSLNSCTCKNLMNLKLSLLQLQRIYRMNDEIYGQNSYTICNPHRWHHFDWLLLEIVYAAINVRKCATKFRVV